MSLGGFWHSYSGGAHGNYGTKYLCFDIVRQKVLQLKDMLIPQGIATAQAFMAKSLRKQLGLTSEEPLSEGGILKDEIPVTENFYLTGIAFSYSPYEIGPYAVGEIEIFLRFQELKAYLQTEFSKKLLKPFEVLKTWKDFTVNHQITPSPTYPPSHPSPRGAGFLLCSCRKQ